MITYLVFSIWPHEPIWTFNSGKTVITFSSSKACFSQQNDWHQTVLYPGTQLGGPLCQFKCWRGWVSHFGMTLTVTLQCCCFLWSHLCDAPGNQSKIYPSSPSGKRPNPAAINKLKQVCKVNNDHSICYISLFHSSFLLNIGLKATDMEKYHLLLLVLRWQTYKCLWKLPIWLSEVIQM